VSPKSWRRFSKVVPNNVIPESRYSYKTSVSCVT
jgi:hypothetical protein